MFRTTPSSWYNFKVSTILSALKAQKWTYTSYDDCTQYTLNGITGLGSSGPLTISLRLLLTTWSILRFFAQTVWSWKSSQLIRHQVSVDSSFILLQLSSCVLFLQLWHTYGMCNIFTESTVKSYKDEWHWAPTVHLRWLVPDGYALSW